MSLLPRTTSSRLPTFQSLFNNFFESDDLFGRYLLNRDLTPAVNVQDKEDHYSLEIAAPGYDKDDFDVSVSDHELVVAAEKKADSKEEENNYMRREFSYSSFRRVFVLPEDACSEDIQASYRDGILRVRLAKTGEQPAPEQRKVTIE